MKTFVVKITTQEGIKHRYTAIGVHGFDLLDAAMTTFGECRSISVIACPR